MKNTIIPFFDLQRQNNEIKDELGNAIVDVINNCSFSLGQSVEKFEKSFAEYCNVDYSVALSSGTSALHLALKAFDIGPGDEVITVPMTFISTIWAITYVGAKPVFVDIDPESYTMDIEQIESKITEHTRAILPVHLYGNSFNATPILALCDKYNIKLIEDCAQAHGAEYLGQKVGSLGNIGCFSFYPSKNLGAFGEGGAITTNDKNVADRIKALRNHAQFEKNKHTELGFNYRMDGIQGAVLNVKLKFLDLWNNKRREIAKTYYNFLSSTSLSLPIEPEWSKHVWHLFVICHKLRDEIRERLSRNGINTAIHYTVPVHLQPAYADLGYKTGDFPVTENLCKSCLSLPMFPELTIDEQYIIKDKINHLDCLFKNL